MSRRYTHQTTMGTPVTSTNKTDCHNITELLLKVALNTLAKEINDLKHC
jgi:hypothetical protein